MPFCIDARACIQSARSTAVVGTLWVLGAMFAASVARATPTPTPQRPRLAVVVVFDQLRAVEFERYTPLFGAGGFGGLDGAVFDATYNYASTETGPGHATLFTATNPDVHGIALNHWFARSKRGMEKQYAVEDERFPVHFASDNAGRSPAMLRVPTWGDALKAETGGQSRVVTVSLKDRAAILSAGKKADLAVWYDAKLGRFTSSAAYGPSLPDWLQSLADTRVKETLAKTTWTPLPVVAEHASLFPADDRPGEGGHEGMGAVFPHNLPNNDDALKRKLYRLLPNTIDDLFALALGSVDKLALGQDENVDLLVVSVSVTDYLGHNYGPDSLEVLDTLRRADRALRTFVAGLNKRVGPGGFVLALTSDHGGTPPPQLMRKTLPGTDPMVSQAILDAAREGVRARRPKEGDRVLGFQPPQVFLRVDDLKPQDAALVISDVAARISALPGVAHVYEMSDCQNDDDSFAPLMRAACARGRNGQLFVRQEPRVVTMDRDDSLGTDHGTPYTYDRRVPLVLFGPGIRRGRHPHLVDVRDIIPTLAFACHAPPPDAATGKPIVAAFEER